MGGPVKRQALIRVGGPMKRQALSKAKLPWTTDRGLLIDEQVSVLLVQPYFVIITYYRIAVSEV